MVNKKGGTALETPTGTGSTLRMLSNKNESLLLLIINLNHTNPRSSNLDTFCLNYSPFHVEYPTH